MWVAWSWSSEIECFGWWTRGNPCHISSLDSFQAGSQDLLLVPLWTTQSHCNCCPLLGQLSWKCLTCYNVVLARIVSLLVETAELDGGICFPFLLTIHWRWMHCSYRLKVFVNDHSRNMSGLGVFFWNHFWLSLWTVSAHASCHTLCVLRPLLNWWQNEESDRKYTGSNIAQ